MKLTNIKIKVETDEENQYVLKQHLNLNKERDCYVYLYGSNRNYNYQYYDKNRAVCSIWKGFRHLVIDSAGDLIICVFEKYYNNRMEKEITFAKFKAMVETKDVIEVKGVKYKGIEE